MYSNNLIFKRIKARIFHSYETFMDNSMNQFEIHMKVLSEQFDTKKFNNPETLEEDICTFLRELQEEVNTQMGVMSYGLALDRLSDQTS